MDRLTHLFLGVVAKPKKTFLEIKEIRPVREGLFIMLVSFVLYLLLLLQPWSADIIIPKIEKGMTYYILAHILGIAVPFILAWILNYFARSERIDSTYIDLLDIFLFSYVASIVLFPFLLVSILSDSKLFYGILSWAALTWGIILIVIGISTSFSISKGRSVRLYARVFLCLFLFILLLGIIGGLIKSKMDRNEKIDSVIRRINYQGGKIKNPILLTTMKHAKNVDVEKLKEKIRSFAASSNITLDSIDDGNGFLEVNGNAENMQRVSVFEKTLRNSGVREGLSAVQKRKDNRVSFAVKCYYRDSSE